MEEVPPKVCKDCKARIRCPEPCKAFTELEAIKKVCKNEFTENFAYSDSKFAEAILKILGAEA